MATDLAGVGQIVNSDVAKKAYDDGLSPAMKQVGALSADMLRAFRLFTAPLQLAAAYHERFEKFCDRVRQRVPESEQCDAPAEIARPVMEAFASTSDGSPMMSMFEELMAKAINKREAKKLSPQFPELIKQLSPLEAVLLFHLSKEEQYTDDIRIQKVNLIVARVGANFSFEDFGGQEHHLTLTQALETKKLLALLSNQDAPPGLYPNLKMPLPDGQQLNRTVIRLTMFGKWFAATCVPKQMPKL